MCGREASAALGTIDTFGKKKQRAHRKCIKWSSEVPMACHCTLDQCHSGPVAAISALDHLIHYICTGYTGSMHWIYTIYALY